MKRSYDSLREAAVAIVRALAKAGHTAYLAGGCVRDRLLGIEPKDYDVATDAPPEVVRYLVRGARLVGESFGVVLVPVRVAGQRHFIEVATFRREWGYADGRRPDRIEFTDAEHDAQRRDFTVNGLFEDPLATAADETGRVIDFVGGVADLKAGVIRAIGDPDERFGEDYLRLLRAVRFAARLGFIIEPRTARAIRSHVNHLGQISRERIGLEVQAMLLGPRPQMAVQLSQQLRLDGPTLSEDHRESSTPTVEAMQTEVFEPALRHAAMLAAWMLDRHAPTDRGGLVHFIDAAMAITLRRWRGALCLNNDDRDRMKAMLLALPVALTWPALKVAGRKRLLALPTWPGTWALLRSLSHRAEVAAVLDSIELEAPPLLAEGVAPPPLVTGDDLIALGRQPGPAFRRWLDEVYDAQLEGRLTDREQALAWLAGRQDKG